MIFDLSTNDGWKSLMEEIQYHRDKGHKLNITKVSGNRTISQNAYLHLILGWFALYTGYSMEEVKLDIFKRTCNSAIFRVIHTSKSGIPVYSVRSTRELTKEEMSVAIERFRNYSANNGLYLPSAEEKAFLDHIKNELEKSKEYL